MTSTLPAPVRCRPRLRRLGGPARDDGPPPALPPPGPPADPRAPTDADRLDARLSVPRVLRLAVEVLDAHRPLAHLAEHAEPGVLRYWRAVAAARPPGRRRTRTGVPRLFLPARGVAEVAVTCVVDGRARALAGRFERGRRTWRCTALRLL